MISVDKNCLTARRWYLNTICCSDESTFTSSLKSLEQYIIHADPFAEEIYTKYITIKILLVYTTTWMKLAS
jgi:hypothetical protein